MSRDDPMAWWYGLIDFERRAPMPGDLKLDQMRALLRAVGQPDQYLRLVHIAGSKGKGSTSAMLARTLRAAGYRTGLFTSPHLVQVEERFQIDGEPISRRELLELLIEIRQAVTPALNPTFFEVATAAGLLHFWRRRTELVVVEVGLGGRFDSTNVIRPLLAIITSISRDHMQFLGETLAEIAFEKGGILKPGRPALSGVTDPAARAVIERLARERGCPLVQLGTDLAVDYRPGQFESELPRVAVRTARRHWPEMNLGLWGKHQAANAALVIAAVEELTRQGLSIRDAHVAEGLRRVHWPARMEVVSTQPLVILDCSHNDASVQALLDTLNESFPRRRRTLIFAASSDKDVPAMLRLLAPQFDRIVLTRYTQNQRAVPPEQLAAWLGAIREGPWEVCDRPTTAWERARNDEMIVVAGSVFLAGELRPLIASGGIMGAMNTAGGL